MMMVVLPNEIAKIQLSASLDSLDINSHYADLRRKGVLVDALAEELNHAASSCGQSVRPFSSDEAAAPKQKRHPRGRELGAW